MNQDPIGLAGGEHLYMFAPNAQGWVDPLGWKKGNGSQTLGKAMITNGRVPNVKNFVRSDWQAHHLIPEEIWDRYANFLNKELGLTRRNGKNGYQNGIFLPNSETIASNAKCKYFHRGSHDTYSRRVRRKLARIRRQYRKDGDKDKARDAIRDLQQNLFNELNQTGMNPIRLS